MIEQTCTHFPRRVSLPQRNTKVSSQRPGLLEGLCTYTACCQCSVKMRQWWGIGDLWGSTQRSKLAASEWPSAGFASFYLICLCNRGLQVLQEVPLSWAERVCDSWFQCPFILSLSKGMLCKEWICNRNGCHDSLKEPASTILANNLVGQAHE